MPFSTESVTGNFDCFFPCELLVTDLAVVRQNLLQVILTVFFCFENSVISLVGGRVVRGRSPVRFEYQSKAKRLKLCIPSQHRSITRLPITRVHSVVLAGYKQRCCSCLALI